MPKIFAYIKCAFHGSQVPFCPFPQASVAEEGRGVATSAGSGWIDDEQVAGGEVALYLVGQMLEIMVVGDAALVGADKHHEVVLPRVVGEGQQVAPGIQLLEIGRAHV